MEAIAEHFEVLRTFGGMWSARGTGTEESTKIASDLFFDWNEEMKPTAGTVRKTSNCLALDPRICGYCANRFRDVHEPCAAEGVYRHFVPELMGRWEDLPDPVPYAEILNLPAQVVRAIYYRDIWYLIHKIRAMEGYFD